MAGSNTLPTHRSQKSSPQDGDVHQGAILFLPKREELDLKRCGRHHVQTLKSAGVIVPNTRRGLGHRFEVLTNTTEARLEAHYHPILVLSRPSADTIEFITLRSYKNTSLSTKREDWGSPKGQIIIEHHLSISPAQHPLHEDPAYRTLQLCDGLQMSVTEGCLSVLPVLTMEWQYTERYFLLDSPNDTESHWRLDSASMELVLKLALDKAGYIPGIQHPRDGDP